MKKKEVSCGFCGSVFLRAISAANEAVKLGRKQYCSKRCQNEAKKSSLSCNCANCLKPVEVLKSVYEKSDTKRFFCGRSCSATFNNRNRPPTTQEKRDSLSQKIKEYYRGEGKGAVSCVCPCCGKTYDVPHRLHEKGLKGYCSKACSLEHHTGVPRMSEQEMLSYLKGLHTSLGVLSSKMVPLSIKGQCRSLFGSWNKAMEAAGTLNNKGINNRNKKAYPCQDGHLADSLGEAFLDNLLSSKGVSHVKNKRYPESKRMTCDFYLSEYDVWVEYLGFYETDVSYRERYTLKQEILKKYNTLLVPVFPEHIGKGLEYLWGYLSQYLITKVPPRVYPVETAPEVILNCTLCGEPFTLLERVFKERQKTGQTNFFCCKAHQVKYQWEQRK
jgi:hypothetical protein